MEFPFAFVVYRFLYNEFNLGIVLFSRFELIANPSLTPDLVSLLCGFVYLLFMAQMEAY